MFGEARGGQNPAVRERVNSLGEKEFTRLPKFEEREAIQKMRFGLPLLPTTTIGSFPQTKEVRANRSAYKKGQIDERQYQEFNCRKIEECIRLQEEHWTGMCWYMESLREMIWWNISESAGWLSVH